MQLTVTSPTDSKTFTITSLEIEALSGELVIQEGHAPAIIVLRPGSYATWILQTEAVIRQKVTRGIVQIERTGAQLLLDSVQEL